MDDNTVQEIAFVASRVEEDDVAITRDSHFHVDFNFSCDRIVCHYYNNVFVGDTFQPNIMSKSVRLDFRQLMNSEYSRRMINQELREWPLDDDDHRDLSVLALDTAKDLIRLVLPPYFNVLIIPFTVLVVCNRRVIDENYLAIEFMTRMSLEEDNSGMVPATESSIESLQIKTTSSHENEESCPICLEDFYAGCEVLSMPCSHIFHEDCIKKWLRSSHYCPICRLEMPIS